MSATLAEKKDEKVVEKRKALGRGLASLLPGPRPVTAPTPRVPSPASVQETGPTEVEPTASTQIATRTAQSTPHEPEAISIPAQPASNQLASSQHTVAMLDLEVIEKN